MSHYFYIESTNFNKVNSTVEKLTGYFTDSSRYVHNPPQEVSRQTAIEMIKTGDVLFFHDGCYRNVTIKIVSVQRNDYLRVDYQPAPFDYFG
jgi:hypothetical protein